MMPAATSAADLTQQQQQQQQQQHQLQQQQQLWMQYQQQQWLAMQQYPAAAAAAMMQQQQLMYQQQQQQQQQHYISPFHHQVHQPYQQQQLLQQQQQQAQIQGGGGGGSSDENRTIWIGDLQNWMDESYLTSCFSHSGEVSSVKIIRNKQTGQSEKYGFVEFLSHAAAEKVLQSFNGTIMPNTELAFRLNWATFSTGDRNADVSLDFSIFVGDLAADVTDATLHDTFATRYPSVKGAKVVVDLNTGRSKGYGFVRFGDENERSRAITEMNGMYCSTRPMRISIATPKKQSGQQQYSSQALVLTGGYAANGAMPQNAQSDGDLSNTTLFVGGLDSDVTDEVLRQTFSQCGEVVSVKIPAGKGCGFVQFANRNSAEDAIQRLTGVVIGSQKVRLSWGRSPGNKQNVAYYGRQGYGYAVPQNQDPNMYAGAYGGSSNGYGNHQQSVS